MTIASKLYFDFKKEYPELLASDVAEFVATKDYEQDILDYKNSITTNEIKNADGTHNYYEYINSGDVISNIRGIDKIDLNKQNIAEDNIYKNYLYELKEFVFNKLLGG